jgi:hypothetical protein
VKGTGSGWTEIAGSAPAPTSLGRVGVRAVGLGARDVRATEDKQVGRSRRRRWQEAASQQLAGMEIRDERRPERPRLPAFLY